MAIVEMRGMLEKAREGKYAVGAFNCFNIEMVQGIITAAEEKKFPLILPLAESHIKFSDWELISYIMKNQAAKASVPIALQLDHAKKTETIEKAIEAGFSTVMFDGYELPFEEKIHQTRDIVEIAHKHGVLVEAPLGKIGTVGKESKAKYDHDAVTDPDLVEEFTTKTGVDILAVSVGTTHGRAIWIMCAFRKSVIRQMCLFLFMEEVELQMIPTDVPLALALKRSVFLQGFLQQL